MIQLIVNSGLGNQLFQYAFARSIQQLHALHGRKHKIAINPRYVRTKILEDTDVRDLSLQHFALNKDITIVPSKLQFIYWILYRIRLLITTPFYILKNYIITKKMEENECIFLKRAKSGLYFMLGTYDFYSPPISKCTRIDIFGYFQTGKYFTNIEDVLRKELVVKTPPSHDNHILIKEISSCNSVCVHIRRGDYLNKSWKHLQVCDFSYYQNCIWSVLNTVEQPVFYIFSNSNDDINWIKTNYHFKSPQGGKINIKYVELNNPDYEEIRLMYSCKHFIISNSTFSWWAAWLSKNKEKEVYVPKKWNTICDDSNIYTEGWHKI